MRTATDGGGWAAWRSGSALACGGPLLVLLLVHLVLPTSGYASTAENSDLPGTSARAAPLLAGDTVPGAPVGPDFELAPLDFRFAGLINTTILAAFHDGEFFLPIGDLFRLLMVDHSVDPRTGRIEGFYIEPDVPYAVDVSAGLIRIGNEVIEVDRDDFLIGEVEIYARPEVLDLAFGLRFRVQMETLRVSLDTRHLLPVAVRAERRRRAERIGDDPLQRPHAPLRFERDRRLFDGAALDYTLRTTVGADGARQSATGRIGVEAFGGELTAAMSGSLSREGAAGTVRDPRLAWRFRDNTWIAEVEVGTELAPHDVFRRSFRGVRATNRPIEPRRQLGTIRLREPVPPGWEVEVYRNQRLLEVLAVGEEGEIDIELPISYGTSDYALRLFGPEGQVRELSYRIPAPVTFLPAGELEYHAELGAPKSSEIAGSGSFFGSTLVAYGLAGWLTTGLGAEAGRFEEGTRLIGIHTAAVRFLGSHLAHTNVRTDGNVRAGIQAFYPSHAAWGVEFIHRASEGGHLTSSGYPNRIAAQGQAPITLRGTRLTLRARSEQRWGSDQPSSGFLRVDLDLRLAGWLTTVGYRRDGLLLVPTQSPAPPPSGSSAIDLALRGSLRGLRQVVGSWLGQTHLRSRVSLNTSDGSLRDFETGLSRRLGREGHMSIGVRHAFDRERTGLDLRYTRTLPQVHATTDLRTAGGAASTLSQTMRGGAAFNRETGRTLFDRGSLVGRGGVIFRPFVDRTGSGVLDPDDEIIAADVIRFRQPVLRVHDPERGMVRVSGLRADSRYSVEVVTDRVRNPLWVPRFDSFSFVTDPSRFKVIDVPFYVAGVVEGGVRRRRPAAEPQPVAGLRIHLRGIDTDFEGIVTTFSDGTFYEMGLPPGDYEAEVDPRQLEMLGAVPEPTVRRFTVQVTRDGDFVSGVDFMLIPGD